MIFYRADDAGHTKLAGTQADAKAVNRNFEQIDIPTDKAGLMVFVQKLYDDIYDLEQGHPETFERGFDAGAQRVINSQPEPQVESITERSVRFEDEFANMPLGLQLHFAALAMENARERL